MDCESCTGVGVVENGICRNCNAGKESVGSTVESETTSTDSVVISQADLDTHPILGEHGIKVGDVGTSATPEQEEELNRLNA